MASTEAAGEPQRAVSGETHHRTGAATRPTGGGAAPAAGAGAGADGGHSPALRSGFQLRIPATWLTLPLADEVGAQRIVGQVGRQALAAGLSPYRVGALVGAVRRMVRQARRPGVVHAAGTFELRPDRALIATVLVSVLETPADGDLIGVLTALPPGGRPDGTWQRSGTAHLPAVGLVGRVHGIQQVPMSGETMTCAVMHTVVALPDARQVLLVTGCSPNVADADDVFATFDRITATLELL